MNKILNPILERTIETGKIDLFKINMLIFLAPIGTFWTCIFLPFTKGKKIIYRKYKNLGNVWSK